MAFRNVRAADVPDTPCACIQSDIYRAIYDLRGQAFAVLTDLKLRENKQLVDFALEVIQRTRGLV